MTSTLHYTEYSMREAKIQKIARRQKLLETKSIQWLRFKSGAVDRSEKKKEIIQRMLEKQFSAQSMEAYRAIQKFRTTGTWS